MHPKLTYTEEFTVRTYQIDSRKRMTVPALVNLMQNVIDLGVSVWDLEQHNISWVLMRFQLNVTRMPTIGERLRIVTRPSGFEKFFTFRDYQVFDEQGLLIVEAPSTWLLMDTQSRRMTRIPPFILEYQMPDSKDCLPRISHKQPEFVQASHSISFEVHWHDLDFNEHLSNIYYIKWMLDSLDQKLLSEARLEKMDIFYRAECRVKEKLISEVQPFDGRSFLHRLRRESDGKEVATAQSHWKYNN